MLPMRKPFERKNQPLLSPRAFRLRLARYVLAALLLASVSLGAGMVGYHVLEKMDWLDSFLNASMILGGMGPVAELKTHGGKLFAGCYALFSGMIFLVVAGLVLSPMIHRLLHKFHFEGK